MSRYRHNKHSGSGISSSLFPVFPSVSFKRKYGTAEKLCFAMENPKVRLKAQLRRAANRKNIKVSLPPMPWDDAQ